MFKKRRKQSILAIKLGKNFVVDIFFFQFIGLWLCNLFRFFSLIIIIPNMRDYPSIYFFGFPPILLISMILIFNKKITISVNKNLKRNLLEGIIPFIIVGFIHIAISMLLFFFDFSVNYFGLCILVIIASVALLYFNNIIGKYDTYIKLSKDKNDFHKIKFLYDDFRMWIKIITNIIIYYSLIIAAYLAIIWGLTPEIEFIDPKFQVDYQIIVSIGLISIFAYTLVGILNWIYMPLVQKMELIRDILFISQTSYPKR